MYSYHIFYFPFKWEIPERKNLLFSEQVDLSKIPINTYTNWERNPKCMNEAEEDELYNEKNYYYQFVHSVLYDTGNDDSIVYHYERRETKSQEVFYIIETNNKKYKLRLDALNMNLYASGVGMLFFFLENNDYPDKNDVLAINQFGRRVFPPFMDDIKDRSQIAQSISIEGLNGVFNEDFKDYQKNKKPWDPAYFIKRLINDLCDCLWIDPVIDDRMFVNCWYKNNDLSKEITKQGDAEALSENDYWYKYLFIESGSITCQNEEMKKKILEQHTYFRWQLYGSLYGFSRYSFVLLSDESDFNRDVLHVHMRTIYTRMTELTLIIKASILKFSNEVTQLSKLSKTTSSDMILIDRISSLYKEYIRFINQMYFQELTIQDQGIELYEKMKETLRLDDYVKDLDKEIDELHNYMVMLEDRTRNRKVSMLNKIATLFLPATLFTGLLSMNISHMCNWSFWGKATVVIATSSLISMTMLLCLNKKKR